MAINGGSELVTFVQQAAWLHLAGTIFGTHDHVAPAEALASAAYNLVAYAAIPLIIFRRRYSITQLNLESVRRRPDLCGG